MKMCVSVTGLKIRDLYDSLKFWVLTIPTFNAVKKAEGILLCKSKGRAGWGIRLLSGQSNRHMLAYIRSPIHVKAMTAKLYQLGMRHY